MIHAHHKTRNRKPSTGGMFVGASLTDQLDTHYGKALLQRLADATCEFTPIDRSRHIRQIALTVLHARTRRG